jgi:hypothetical protein
MLNTMVNIPRIYKILMAPAKFAGILGTGVVAWPNCITTGWF